MKSSKLIRNVSFCLFVSIGMIVVLFLLSEDLKRRPGSFLREFPPHPVVEANDIDLGFNTYYIAGATNQKLYLSNYTAPLHLLVFNNTLTDSQHVAISIKDIDKQLFRSVRVSIDSPYFYFADGNVPIMYKGDVKSFEAKHLAIDSAYFLDYLPINENTFCIKALGKPVVENVLGKLGLSSHPVIKSNILRKQLDGVFCTDGMISYNQKRQEIVYLYYYRNEFIVMDTALRVLRTGHTIDTTSRANITVGTIDLTGTKTLSSPPRLVNKLSSVWNDYFFVCSATPARNESIDALNQASVIDVYALTNFEYLFSFYVYHYQGKEPLRQFIVYGDKLYALFEKQLQVFEIQAKYFE